MKILFVCLGNICRSPLGEGILKHKVQKKKLRWKVDSAGTSGWHTNETPDKRSIHIARKYGIDISGQRARQFSPYDFDFFDHILVMDRQNQRDVLRLARSENDKKKVTLLLDLLKPGQNLEVPDPYYDDNGFEEVYSMIDRACDRLIEVLTRKS